MIPDGLHVAIAAWIDRKRAYSGFLSVPTEPVAVTPSNLEPVVTGVKTSSELALAAEFALLTNFVPRKGSPADPFGPHPALWLVHRETLANMRFAAQSLTAQEIQDLAHARGMLYATDDSGRTVPSERFLAYQEMRAVVGQLEEQDSALEVLQAAYADWLVRGYKIEVEAALAVLDRLARRSTRTDAAQERMGLEDGSLSRSADLAFAPTYFAPLSATQELTWSRARVSYSDLRAAVPGEAADTAQPFVASTAEGYCEFGYTVLEVVRHWFSYRLYLSDDWRLTDSQTVSSGNGREGTIPAYPQSAYLARVLTLSAPLGPTTAGAGSSTTGAVRGGTLVVNPRGGVRLGPVLSSRPLARAGVVGVPSRATTTPTSVLPGREVRPLSATAINDVASRVPGRLPVPWLPPRPPVEPAEWRARLDHLRLRYRDRSGAPAAPMQPPAAEPALTSSALVVGFGCAVIPPAPSPNETYMW